MNKQTLLDAIQVRLQQTLQAATEAALRAYNTATDDENVAENQYDTLALEASYLAHGQAQRVEECKADVTAYQILQANLPQSFETVLLGHIVTLADENDNMRFVFLGPSAGGLVLTVDNNTVTIVTPTSPFGDALIGREIGEEIDVHIGNKVIWYEVMAIN
ncbi:MULTISPECIES: GreA/GreB family elongation factor [unclassified Photobacterium]|uniref:GreA/GreB family elongation factor n=1 Tax=unclassified Photobacterium TaxID=2628852 RepID=UPI001EDD2616|nr:MULTISPECIES: GreA/GreB family elongation factor [unclassified Photobacterium]MCG3863489.1 GreA/GreB family elongation factor [Photobacterium sp. Ph6]MCG3875018.1 GreA/GreB family elongation factor [Photobacterium sp. Ph5]